MAIDQRETRTQEVEPADSGLAFQAQYLRALGIDPIHCMVVVANDDTMAPRIRTGDTLIINRLDRTLVEGRVYGLLFEDRLRLRTYSGAPPRFECGFGTRLLHEHVSVIGRVVYRSGTF